MFTSWNIADSLLTSATDGHQFWEPKLLSQELKRRGKAVRLLGHKSIAAANFPDAESVPLFPLYFTEPNSRDPTWGYLENFIVQNRGFEEALVTFPASLLRDAIMLFPNVTERQLLGIFRWIGLLEVRNLPGIAIVLSALQNWGTTNPSIEVYRKLWSECPPETKERLRLCARTEITAQKFEETLGTRPHVLPSVLAPTAHEVAAARECAASASDPVSVVFVGGARRERGALLVPDVVRQCLAPGIRFRIQITDWLDISFDVRLLRALRELPGVEIHEGVLPRDVYNAWIAGGLILLPYERESYRSRSSGVYFEAKCFGSPVIVPDGTWMAEDVRRCGNGLVFDDHSPAAIARTIAAAQADLPQLRARALASGEEFRARHGADRFVDALESLVSRG